MLAAFAVAVVGLAVFARLTTHHPSPVIDPALLRVRAFAWANVATLVFNTGFGISLLAGVLWMQQVWGYSALRTGFAVALGPLLVPISSAWSQRLLPRVRPSRFVTVGALVAATGALLMAVRLDEEPSYWTTFFPGWAVIGIAVGLVMPNLIAAATGTLPPQQASTGGGVISMSRQLGLVLGVSILVSMLGASGLTSATFTAAWLVVAGVSLLAAGSAFAMEAARRPAVEMAAAVRS